MVAALNFGDYKIHYTFFVCFLIDELFIVLDFESCPFLRKRKPDRQYVELTSRSNTLCSRFVKNKVLDSKISIEAQIPSDKNFVRRHACSLGALNCYRN